MVDDPYKTSPNLIGKWYCWGSIIVPTYGIQYDNHVVNVEYLEARKEEFVTGSGQLTYSFTKSNGKSGSVEVETNVQRYGDGTRKLIERNSDSEAIDVWQWEEILNASNEVTGVALRDGFHLGVIYRITYKPVFTDPGTYRFSQI